MTIKRLNQLAVMHADTAEVYTLIANGAAMSGSTADEKNFRTLAAKHAKAGLELSAFTASVQNTVSTLFELKT